jgi:hypothetical protein
LTDLTTRFSAVGSFLEKPTGSDRFAEKENVMRNLLKVIASVLATLFLAATASAQFSSPVRDVENPARSPFLWSSHGTVSRSQSSGEFPVADVPVRQRVIIEFVSAYCESAPVDNLFYSAISVLAKDRSPEAIPGKPLVRMAFPIPLLKQGTTQAGEKAAWAAAQMTRIYAEADGYGGPPLSQNFEIRFVAGHSGTAPVDVECNVSISGYILPE